LMAIAESGLNGSCGDQALADPRFWQNAEEHLRNEVREERNHPSIVAWSIDNEMGAFLQQTNPVPWEKLSRLTRVVKTNDPTRIAWHDGFAYGLMTAHLGSPVENDVLALHYPCGPESWAIYYNQPEACLWSERMLRDPKAFGGLPVGIGEYAMVPPTIGWETENICHQPLHQAPFLGERKTTWPNGSLRWYWDLHWLSMSLSLRGNRAGGLTYISPCTTVQHYLQQSGGAYPEAQYTNAPIDWNTPGIKIPLFHATRVPLLDMTGQRPPYIWQPMIEPVAKANHPLLVFPRLLGTRFWSEDSVQRSFFVFNDLYRPSRLNLTIELLNDTGAVLDHWTAKPTLPPGEHREMTASFRLPKVDQRKALTLHIRNASDAGQAFEDDLVAAVFPPIDVPEFVLVDPDGSTARRLTVAGVRFTPVSDPAKLPADKPVVIGENDLSALSSNAVVELRHALEQGRTVVCLAHTNAAAYAAAWGAWAVVETGLPRWPYLLQPGQIPTTVAHMTAAADPVTSGLDPEDVRFWGPTSAVAYYGLMLPVQAPGAKTLVMCNRPKQDDNRSLLTRVPMGKGTLFLCQLLIPDNAQGEPVARLLLARMLAPAAP
jgi:hypothetical protein